MFLKTKSLKELEKAEVQQFEMKLELMKSFERILSF